MYTLIVSGVAVLLAVTPSTLALGSVSVTNMCAYSVYYASAMTGQYSAMQPMYPGGGLSQQYSVEGQGVSIKLARDNSESGPISQFEYTWASGKINYDLSNINGYPLSSGGMTAIPSIENDPNNPTCVPIVCPAGIGVCEAAYNQPNDTRTMVCNDEVSISLTLCPQGSSKRDVPVHASAHASSYERTLHRRHGHTRYSI
jgi:hypothetical protein